MYNIVINRNKHKGYDFIILLDQDSEFTEQFFIKLQEAYSKNPQIKLFLPIIKFKNTIVSPTKKFFLKGFYYTKKPSGVIRAKNISAINSGMIISFNYLEKNFPGYDESLNFYGTDDYFMIEFCKKNSFIYILDYEFEHDLTLSTLNNKTSEKLVKAYHQMLDAWIIIYSKKYSSFFIKIYAIFHSIYTSIKYKDKRFLKWK